MIVVGVTFLCGHRGFVEVPSDATPQQFDELVLVAQASDCPRCETQSLVYFTREELQQLGARPVDTVNMPPKEE